MNVKGKGGKRCADIDNRVPYVAGWSEDAVDRKRLVRLIAPTGHVEGLRGITPARPDAHLGMICDTFGVKLDEAIRWCDFHEVARPADPPATWRWSPPAPPPPKPKAATPKRPPPPFNPNFKPKAPEPILYYHPAVAAALHDGTLELMRWVARELTTRGPRELPAIAEEIGVSFDVMRAAVDALKMFNGSARTAVTTGTLGETLDYLKAHPETRAMGLETANVCNADTAHKNIRQLATRLRDPAVIALKNSAKLP